MYGNKANNKIASWYFILRVASKSKCFSKL